LTIEGFGGGAEEGDRKLRNPRLIKQKQRHLLGRQENGFDAHMKKGRVLALRVLTIFTRTNVEKVAGK